MFLNSTRAAASTLDAASDGARALWKQICIGVRVELTPAVASAIRDLLAPCGATLARPPGGDLERAARILAVAGLRLADPIEAARGHPIWIEASGSVDKGLALLVDAVASDRSHIATWRPTLERKALIAQLRPPPARTFGPGSEGARALRDCLAQREAVHEMHGLGMSDECEQFAPAAQRLAA